MITLIRNEFYKQKREWSFLFLLLLSLLPVLTGGAGAIFNNSTKTLADLFFFMNNQFAMFFPYGAVYPCWFFVLSRVQKQDLYQLDNLWLFKT